MLYQINPIIEFQFLFYLIPVFLGIQLAVYFFYQYFKIQDTQLKLNRILLSFGTFIILLVLGALIIQIARNFIINPTHQLFVYKIGWVTAFASPIGLEIFVLEKDFSSIFNLKLIILLILLNIIAIVLAILAPSTRSIPFYIAIGFVVLNGINVLRFELLLISNSYGKIKKKFKFFFIGTIISLVALFFAIFVGLGILSTLILELIFYYSGITFLLAGFIVIFYTAYDFPPFYEFEWRKNLLKFLVINPKTNKPLFYFDFLAFFNNQSKKFDQIGDLFSGGIIGIDSVISSITGIKNQRIDKIENEGSSILLEYGIEPYNLVFALILKKDLMSLRIFLRNVKIQFESFYRDIFPKLDDITKNQDLLFGSFELILKNMIK